MCSSDMLGHNLFGTGIIAYIGVLSGVNVGYN